MHTINAAHVKDDHARTSTAREEKKMKGYS